MSDLTGPNLLARQTVLGWKRKGLYKCGGVTVTSSQFISAHNIKLALSLKQLNLMSEGNDVELATSLSGMNFPLFPSSSPWGVRGEHSRPF